MSILKIYDQEVSTELTSFLEDLRPNVESYVTAKQSAQRSRMEIIGKVCEYRRQFPQRSTDHRLLSQAMSNEGWSGDVIKNNDTAYQAFKSLSENVNPEFQRLAEVATPTQLLVLGRGKDTELAYDAAKHLKREGEVPSANNLRHHLNGMAGKDFKHINTKLADEKRIDTELKTVTPIVTPELSSEEKKFNYDCDRLNIRYDSRSTVRTRIESEGLKHIDDVMSSYYHGGGVKENAMACMKVVLQHLERSNPDTQIVELLLNAAAAIKSKDNTSSDVVTVVEVKAAEPVFDGKERNGVRWRR